VSGGGSQTKRESAAPGAGATGPPAEPSKAAQTDWLRNLLTVSGPAEEVARFRATARGTGGIPWHLDLDHEEARLLAPMATLGPAARSLVRELREVIARRHDRMLARWAETGTCPLDLQRLIPVPDAILPLGEDAPEARQWLLAHWGTTQTLRRVRLRDEHADRRLRRSARLVYEFFSADWTPWQAVRQLRRDWPRLIFAICPCYDDPDGTGDV
jgi:hypothetical protein